MRITGGLVFDAEKGFVRKDVCTSGDRISELSGDGGVLSADGMYVIPGLTDLHFHGCMGEDFSDGSYDGLKKMGAYELSRGITQICPAGMTLLPGQLEKICSVAAKYRRSPPENGAELVGVNLEGPFLSEKKKGAQNGAWLQKPNIELLKKLSDISEGLVKLVTVAPELEGAMEFISEASETVTVSIGHTTADYNTAKSAINAGARQLTHMFNAMPPLLHRDPGVIGAGFEDSRVSAEIICDGVHIHPAVIKAAFKLFGADRVILISDTMRAAGMCDGQYTLGGLDVTVRGARAELSDGTIAGSATDLMKCMKTAVDFGIDPETAVRAAAVNSARVLGIDDLYGSLERGKIANIVILRPDFEPERVIFRGAVMQKGKSES